ncbi:uncharacterized protein RHOBADRAFT_55080, partial [Rhodotorula graminis WP1]
PRIVPSLYQYQPSAPLSRHVRPLRPPHDLPPGSPADRSPDPRHGAQPPHRRRPGQVGPALDRRLGARLCPLVHQPHVAARDDEARDVAGAPGQAPRRAGVAQGDRVRGRGRQGAEPEPRRGRRGQPGRGGEPQRCGRGAAGAGGQGRGERRRGQEGRHGGRPDAGQRCDRRREARGYARGQGCCEGEPARQAGENLVGHCRVEGGGGQEGLGRVTVSSENEPSASGCRVGRRGRTAHPNARSVKRSRSAQPYIFRSSQ